MAGTDVSSLIGTIAEGAGASFGVGAQVADYQWGKDLERKRYLGNTYLGGNPQMAGRYQGEFANIGTQIEDYTYHKVPLFTKIAGALSTILSAAGGTVGNLSSSMGGGTPSGTGGTTNSYYGSNPENWSNDYNFYQKKSAQPLIDEYRFGEENVDDWPAVPAKSGIYIKPSKRGTFTRWCKEHGYGGVTSECISAAKGKGGAIAKKGTFAANAHKWKKGEDGLDIPPIGDEGPGNYLGTPETTKDSLNALMHYMVRSVTSPYAGLGVNDPNTQKYYSDVSKYFSPLAKELYGRDLTNEEIDKIVNSPKAGFLPFAKSPYLWNKSEEEIKPYWDLYNRTIPDEMKYNKTVTPKLAQGGQIIEDVQGKEHEEGGEKRMLNGVPVEVEDDEWIIRMDDGSIAVLNESQQRMLQRGKPLQRIVKSLPKVANNAQEGIDIPPLENEYYDDLWAQPGSFLRAEEGDYGYPNIPPYPNDIHDPSLFLNQDYIGGIKQFNNKTPKGNYAYTIPENKKFSTSKVTPEIVTSPVVQSNPPEGELDKIMNDYKQSQLIGQLSGVNSSILQGGTAMANLFHNRKEAPPKTIPKMTPIWPTFTPVNTAPMERQINMQTRAAMRQANETGRPELLTPIMAGGQDTLLKLFGEAEGINAQTRNQGQQIGVQSTLETNKMNVTSSAEDIKNKFVWDTTMATAQQQNLESLFASLNGIGKVTGQGKNNMLSADIVNYLIGSGYGSDQIMTMLKQFGLE